MGSSAQVQQLKNPDKDDPWDGVSDRQDCAVWFPRLGPWCQNLLISSWALELHLSLYLVSLSLSLSGVRVWVISVIVYHSMEVSASG